MIPPVIGSKGVGSVILQSSIVRRNISRTGSQPFTGGRFINGQFYQSAAVRASDLSGDCLRTGILRLLGQHYTCTYAEENNGDDNSGEDIFYFGDFLPSV